MHRDDPSVLEDDSDRPENMEGRDTDDPIVRDGPNIPSRQPVEWDDSDGNGGMSER